jgi:Bacterial PH domain
LPLSRRDITFFTTKRIIYIDPKGLKSIKVEYTSIPWKSVLCFGVKTAGKHLDKDCEAMIYTDMMFDPPVKQDDAPKPGMSFWELDFNKDLVDTLAIEKYLSARCLQQAPNIPVPPSVFMVSEDEGGLEKLLSKLGDDQRAIDPSELDTIFHTTLPILLDDEKIIMAFKAGRDMTLFTNLRIMELDTQGWSGQKTVYRSIPFASIRAFAAESTGGWDRDAELGIYTRNLWSLKRLKFDFRRGKADVIAIQKFLAAVVFGNHDEPGKYLESRESAVRKGQSANLNSFVSFLTDNSKEEDASIVDVQLHSDPPILLDAEHVAHAFRSGRDMFVYTNLRVLLVDVQGLRGTKVEYKSIPWTWCQDFEIETAGHLDRDAELYLHLDIPAIDVLKHSILVNSFDIHEMQQFICSTLLFPKAKDL